MNARGPPVREDARRRHFSETLFFVGFTLAVAAFLATAVASYRAFQDFSASTADVDQSRRVIANIDSLLDTLGDLEARQRAYLLSEEPEFLLPYSDRMADVEELLASLDAAPAGASAEDLQNIVYEIGKKHPFPELRAWFKTLYEVLLGQETGPRMGTFIALYGKDETATLIRQALAGKIG